MEKKISIQDMSEFLSGRNGMPSKDAELFVRSVFEIIEEYLKKDNIVKVKGLGTFKLVAVESRESVDVNTGERILLKGYMKVSFIPDTVLRDEINKPFSQFETVALYDTTDLSEMQRLDGERFDEMPDEDFRDSEGYDNQETEAESHEQQKATVIFEKDGLVDEPVLANSLEDEDEGFSENVAVGHLSSEASDDSNILNETYPMAETDKVEVDLSNGEETNVLLETECLESQGTLNPKNETDNIEVNTEDGQQVAGNQRNEFHKEAENVEHLHTEYQHVDAQQVEDIEVGCQRIKKQHAVNQHIDMQTVEHQTVENQHIVQVAGQTSAKIKKNVPPLWALVLIVLGVLLLMLGSYFVGYYRLLCPNGCETVSYISRMEVAGDMPVIRPEGASQVKAVSDTLAADTFSIDTSQTVKVPVAQIAEATSERQVEANKGAIISKTAKTTKRSEKIPAKVERNASSKINTSVYPQLEGGRYEIIGTLATITLKSGQTLRNLALKYYGSKNYVPYIVIYNRIENPDVIPVGAEIKIPELRVKEE